MNRTYPDRADPDRTTRAGRSRTARTGRPIQDSPIPNSQARTTSTDQARIRRTQTSQLGPDKSGRPSPDAPYQTAPPGFFLAQIPPAGGIRRFSLAQISPPEASALDPLTCARRLTLPRTGRPSCPVTAPPDFCSEIAAKPAQVSVRSFSAKLRSARRPVPRRLRSRGSRASERDLVVHIAAARTTGRGKAATAAAATAGPAI